MATASSINLEQMILLDAVKDRRPIWLTSFWGFRPETWGCVGFTLESHYQRFLRDFVLRDGPAGLVAIYVTQSAPEPSRLLRGKLAGFMEIGRNVGQSFDFIDLKKEPAIRTALDEGRWLHSVQATRAWRLVTPLDITRAAPESYDAKSARYIGTQGVEMTDAEVEALHQLPVRPANVYAPLS